MAKYGVRIYPLDLDTILVKQTIMKQGSKTYVVDTFPNGDHREAHPKLVDDKGIADAVRSALNGRLLRS